MSTWTLKEVRALSEKHGGGNKCCIEKYLSHGDVEKYRPKPGDSLDKYKTFVRLAYEEKQFMANPEENAEEEEEQAEETVAEPAEQPAEPAEEEDLFDIPEKKPAKKASKKASTPVEDEDFDAEEEEKEIEFCEIE